ncbi:MAG: phytase [Pseudomonadota bacterium]|nr:phytase [Pseudomonadota bacterium]
MPIRPLAGACAALLLAACASTPAPPTPPAAPAPVAIADSTAGSAPAPVEVVEAWTSAPLASEELDSLATWTSEEGDTWLIASAKSTHRLVVHDANTGALLRTVGSKGEAPGQFLRPNGLAVFGDRLYVVERDNHRVQVLALPGFEPVASFGGDVLRSPYGIWLNETEPGELQAYVTDSFMYGERYDIVPPYQELAQRVRRFRVQSDQDGSLRVQYGGAFGDIAPATALRMVESLAGDPAHDRLMVADESRSDDNGHRGSTLREYTLDGEPTGRSMPHGSFAAEAEGVVLWNCPGDGGYWIAVDQLAPLTIFHLFDRDTLEPRGSFQGRTTAFTDGVALDATASARFPGGALYAVSDDIALAAFDLRDVVAALDLDLDCVR